MEHDGNRSETMREADGVAHRVLPKQRDGSGGA